MVKYMKELPQTSVRKMRYGEILNMITECSQISNGIKKERLIAEFCIRYGCSRRKIMEYISDLLNSGRIGEKPEGKDLIYFKGTGEALPETEENGV